MKTIALMMLIFSFGCASNSPGQSVTERDRAAVLAVQKWYSSKGYAVPDRIKIAFRGEKWLLYAGIESVEASFVLDPKKMRIVEVVPGD